MPTSDAAALPYAFRPEQLPLAAYGLIADNHTAALAGADGNIAWMCVPHFDSPAIFATLIDAERGGHFLLAPTGAPAARQRYLRDTNVLVTRFARPGQVVEITDWLATGFPRGGARAATAGALCRRIEVLEGEAELRCRCAPRGDYGRTEVHWRPYQRGWTGALARAEASSESAAGRPDALWFWSDLPLAAATDLTASVPLRQSEKRYCLLSWNDAVEFLWSAEAVEASLEETIRYWRDWIGQARYQGPYREAVLRSALVLKSLCYEPTGAIVAAPTASLPEAIGGARNWDYRYCWPRDATFALYGLSLLGFHEEAGRLLEFIAHQSAAHPLPLQVCYRVDGRADLDEIELNELSGYRGSRPVRIGNGAIRQRQMDLYGEILDAAYTYAKWRQGLERPLWERLAELIEYAIAHWREPDESIWEVRGGPRHFLYSKVMCWVAVDRGLKMARRYGLPAPIERWQAAWQAQRREILRRGYDRHQHAFTQAFGSPTLDASALLLPLVRFLSPHDPRMEATIRRIQQRLIQGALVARYEDPHADGVGGPEGAFSLCTFWLIDCLTLVGRSREAHELMEQMLRLGSPLGLYSEEIDPASGELLGNFPQAFTHMALINSAHNLQLYPAGVAK